MSSEENNAINIFPLELNLNIEDIAQLAIIIFLLYFAAAAIFKPSYLPFAWGKIPINRHPTVGDGKFAVLSTGIVIIGSGLYKYAID